MVSGVWWVESWTCDGRYHACRSWRECAKLIGRCWCCIFYGGAASGTRRSRPPGACVLVVVVCATASGRVRASDVAGCPGSLCRRTVCRSRRRAGELCSGRHRHVVWEVVTSNHGVVDGGLSRDHSVHLYLCRAHLALALVLCCASTPVRARGSALRGDVARRPQVPESLRPVPQSATSPLQHGCLLAFSCMISAFLASSSFVGIPCEFFCALKHNFHNSRQKSGASLPRKPVSAICSSLMFGCVRRSGHRQITVPRVCF